MEIRTHIRATPAASLAGKTRLKIGQANVIRPSIAAGRSPMRAAIIIAVDQKTANASGAHLGKGDFLGAGSRGHAPLKRCQPSK